MKVKISSFVYIKAGKQFSPIALQFIYKFLSKCIFGFKVNFYAPPLQLIARWKKKNNKNNQFMIKEKMKITSFDDVDFLNSSLDKTFPVPMQILENLLNVLLDISLNFVKSKFCLTIYYFHFRRIVINVYVKFIINFVT